MLLNRRAADLLFSVPFAETGDPCLLYLLFEHQSTPDPRMPFHLLVYMTRVWERHFKDNPRSNARAPILPLVLFQDGTSGTWPPISPTSSLAPGRTGNS